MTRSWRAIVALAYCAALLTACGRGDEGAQVVPEKVNVELVPPVLGNGLLTLLEDTKAKKSFGRLPENALVADGRLFAVRQGPRLVATLQLSTLVPEVDLTDPKRKREIVSKLLPGIRQELSVADMPVYQVAGEDKVVYVWFGRQMFEVFQIKGSAIEPEKLLTEVVRFQLESPAWKPLPETQEEA
ncbi:MAG TPA: hypothetical protein VMZ22_14255 [Acidimicrobiales bacterium]|nr:hypothetical protein [Acidimicrobiales bacterium]